MLHGKRPWWPHCEWVTERAVLLTQELAAEQGKVPLGGVAREETDLQFVSARLISYLYDLQPWALLVLNTPLQPFRDITTTCYKTYVGGKDY